MKTKPPDPEITKLCDAFGLSRNAASRWRALCKMDGADLWAYKKGTHRKKLPKATNALEELVVRDNVTYFELVNGEWVLSTFASAKNYVKK